MKTLTSQRVTSGGRSFTEFLFGDTLPRRPLGYQLDHVGLHHSRVVRKREEAIDGVTVELDADGEAYDPAQVAKAVDDALAELAHDLREQDKARKQAHDQAHNQAHGATTASKDHHG